MESPLKKQKLGQSLNSILNTWLADPLTNTIVSYLSQDNIHYLKNNWSKILDYEWAIENDRLDLCHFLCQRVKPSSYVLRIAVLQNKWDVLKLLFRTFPLAMMNNTDLITYATEVGNLALIEWFLSKGCILPARICTLAAFYNQFHILVWARHVKFCSWDAQTCADAIKSHNFQMLEWLVMSGCPYDDVCLWRAAAIHHDDLKIFKMLRNLGCPLDNWTLTVVAGNGHLKIVKWLHQNGFQWDQRTCAYAAGGGHLDLLKWLRQNNCPWDQQTCAHAAYNGHLDVLKWARQNGCPWDSTTCTFAAEEGHLETLQWARQNGCSWDENTSRMAAVNRHEACLKWLVENGCPYVEKTFHPLEYGDHGEILFAM